MQPTVAVIGAGVVGASVAFRLAQRGATVWIIDKAQPGQGTSGASFAWVNSNQKTPRDYFELNLAGLREHQALRDELGAAPWLHDGGNLTWAVEADAQAKLTERVERLRGWGYAAEWRDTDALAELEPHVRPPQADLPIAYFPEEAWADAPLLALRLVTLAQELGAQLRTDSAVTGIETTGSRVSGVRLADGERIAVDAVVNAAGPSADRVAAILDLPLPLAPTSGLLVRVHTGTDLVGRIIHTPRVNIRPDGPGHLLLHHDSIDAQLDDRDSLPLDDPLCHELLDRARQVLNGLDNAEIVAARIGVRPYPADGRSCVGAVSTIQGYYEAVTHSGVTLGPLLGRLLAQEILTGDVDPLAAPFRPDRFPRT